MSTIGLLLLLLFAYLLFGPWGVFAAYIVFLLSIFYTLTSTSGTF